MKNSFFPLALLLLTTLFYFGCKNEEVLIEPLAPSTEITDEPTDGSRGPILATVRPYPRYDLVITNYTTNIGPVTSLCGPVLPNVSCAGGQRFFMATVTVTNQGTGTVPANAVLQIGWTDTTPNTSNYLEQTPNHGPIAAGASVQVTRPYNMGPCDCPPPFTSFLHQFSAVVNPNATILETNYNNNNSTIYNACDGC